MNVLIKERAYRRTAFTRALNLFNTALVDNNELVIKETYQVLEDKASRLSSIDSQIFQEKIRQEKAKGEP